MLKKIQTTEYDILKEFDRICKKHNIKYFIGQGTLLGAAKYKGFIPWDDDIDLLVPQKELKKVFDVFDNEADKRYMLTNYKREKYYPLSWAKIRDKNTLSRPYRYKDLQINWGICIDLFSIFSLNNNKFLRKLEYINYKFANKLLLAEFTRFEDGHGLFVRMLEKIPRRLRHFHMDMTLKALSLNKDNSKYVMVNCKGVKIFKRDIFFGEEKFLSFEDGIYPVPYNYHEYLTANFGDYMAPLPKEQQRGHEDRLGDIEWKL